MGTYIKAAGGDTAKAVDLYGWNARVSAALLLPSHFAEVSTRNAVSEALTAKYGARWPWEPAFEKSLPSPVSGFKPVRELIQTRGTQPTTGKVVAELKFAFWQSMFTARHDGRLWKPFILGLFPHAAGATAKELRLRIYNDLEVIRQLRNRIAHHEPIFTRNLGDDLMRILELVELRCDMTADWVFAMEEVGTILTERP